MSLLSEVRAIGPAEALEIEKSAKAGDKDAAIRFLHYSLWRTLSRDLVIPGRLKPKLFKAITENVKVSVEVVGSHV